MVPGSVDSRRSPKMSLQSKELRRFTVHRSDCGGPEETETPRKKTGIVHRVDYVVRNINKTNNRWREMIFHLKYFRFKKWRHRGPDILH